jgi:phage virion morphogenesis protein
MIEIKIDDKRVRRALDRMKRAVVDLTPAMRDIAATLEEQTSLNFEERGRPKWPALSRATLEKYVEESVPKARRWRKDGRISRSASGTFTILQHSGNLVNSITSDYDSRHAMVGTALLGSDNYGAIHQFGGRAGRNHKVVIPARPYLPMVGDHSLQPEAVRPVLEAIQRHLQHAIDGC